MPAPDRCCLLCMVARCTARRGRVNRGVARGRAWASVRPMTDTNWAGNYPYRAGILHRPSTVEQVRELVADAFRMRVLGSRHSFTDIADSSALLSLDGLPADVGGDRAAGTVSCSEWLRDGELEEARAG